MTVLELNQPCSLLGTIASSLGVVPEVEKCLQSLMCHHQRESFLHLLIVCLQCDAISTLEKEHDYRDEHLDFIQSHIRRFCLQCILQMVPLLLLLSFKMFLSHS